MKRSALKFSRSSLESCRYYYPPAWYFCAYQSPYREFFVLPQPFASVIRLPGFLIFPVCLTGGGSKQGTSFNCNTLFVNFQGKIVRVIKECHFFACVCIESDWLRYDAPFVQFSYGIIHRVYSKGKMPETVSLWITGTFRTIFHDKKVLVPSHRVEDRFCNHPVPVCNFRER